MNITFIRPDNKTVIQTQIYILAAHTEFIAFHNSFLMSTQQKTNTELTENAPLAACEETMMAC